MKLKHIITLAVLALGTSALVVSAQDNNDGPPGSNGGPGPNGGPAGGPGGPGGGPGRHHRPPPLPLILSLDANHDGIIDASEIANASVALKTLDKNGDGQLTIDEYMPPLPKDAPADAPRPPMPLILKALDANGDGVIDATEIANATVALKTLDKNGDGQLTRDEYLGKHPGHPPRNGNGPEGDAGGPPPPPEGDFAGGPGGPGDPGFDGPPPGDN
jgi:hypothetical protein